MGQPCSCHPERCRAPASLPACLHLGWSCNPDVDICSRSHFRIQLGLPAAWPFRRLSATAHRLAHAHLLAPLRSARLWPHLILSRPLFPLLFPLPASSARPTSSNAGSAMTTSLLSAIPRRSLSPLLWLPPKKLLDFQSKMESPSSYPFSLVLLAPFSSLPCIFSLQIWVSLFRAATVCLCRLHLHAVSLCHSIVTICV